MYAEPLSESAPPAPGERARQLASLLVDVGFPQAQAKRMVSQHELDVIERQLTYLAQRQGVADPVSFLRAAIAQDYEAPSARRASGRKEAPTIVDSSKFYTGTYALCRACGSRPCSCAERDEAPEARPQTRPVPSSPPRPTVVAERAPDPAPAPEPAPELPPLDLSAAEYETVGFPHVPYLQLPQDFLDRKMHCFEPPEFMLLVYILRRTAGFHRQSDAISLDRFSHGYTTSDGDVIDEGTGMSRSTVQRALESLQKRGIITKTARTRSNGATASPKVTLHWDAVMRAERLK